MRAKREAREFPRLQAKLTVQLGVSVLPSLARVTLYAAQVVLVDDTARASTLAAGLLRGREQRERMGRDLKVGLPGDRCAFGSAHERFNPSSRKDAAAYRGRS
jgi:hypothetical protein